MKKSQNFFSNFHELHGSWRTSRLSIINSPKFKYLVQIPDSYPNWKLYQYQSIDNDSPESKKPDLCIPKICFMSQVCLRSIKLSLLYFIVQSEPKILRLVLYYYPENNFFIPQVGFCGTVGFMAPEIARCQYRAAPDDLASPASDMFR